MAPPLPESSAHLPSVTIAEAQALARENPHVHILYILEKTGGLLAKDAKTLRDLRENLPRCYVLQGQKADGETFLSHVLRPDLSVLSSAEHLALSICSGYVEKIRRQCDDILHIVNSLPLYQRSSSPGVVLLDPREVLLRMRVLAADVATTFQEGFLEGSCYQSHVQGERTRIAQLLHHAHDVFTRLSSSLDELHALLPGAG